MTDLESINPALHPAILAGLERGYEVRLDGTAVEWHSDGAMLSYRGERQALPGGACPLGFQGRAICGQWFYAEDVAAMQAATGYSAVIFERQTR